MSKITLDKSKPYGQIFGDLEGRVFEQDSRYFKGDGSLWRDPNAKESAAEKAAREKQEADAAAAEEQRLKDEAEALKAAGGNNDQLSKQLTGGAT